MMNLDWSHAYALLTIIASGWCRQINTPMSNRDQLWPVEHENGEPLFIANIAATDSYRELALKSVPYQSPEHNLNIICGHWYSDRGEVYSYGPDRVPSFEEIFAENLKKIRDEATTVLGHEAHISSISAPSQFNDTFRQAIKHAAADTLNHFEYDRWRISTPEYGTLHWFRLRQCEEPGHIFDGASEVPSEQRYVIFVNMDYDYLVLVLLTVVPLCTEEFKDDGVLETVSRVPIGNMGTRTLYRASQILQDDQDDDRWLPELRRFWRELDHAFGDFADAHFSEHNHPLDPEEDTRDGTLHPESLKVIVISGDLPRYVFEGVRYTVAINFPGSQHRVLDSINPAWVGAVGVAQLAKSQVEYPDRFEPLQAYFLEPLITPEIHDEL